MIEKLKVMVREKLIKVANFNDFSNPLYCNEFLFKRLSNYIDQFNNSMSEFKTSFPFLFEEEKFQHQLNSLESNPNL